MVARPSRRDVLSGSVGVLAGVVGGGVVRPHLALGADSDAGESPNPVPLAWADTEWPFPDYDAARTRHPPAASAPAGDLDRDWRIETGPAHSRAPPVVANGRVVTGAVDSRGTTIRAVAVDGGAPAWGRSLRSRRPRAVWRGTGPRQRAPRWRSPASAHRGECRPGTR